MRYMCMLIVMTAMVFVAVSSARGITSPGPLMFDGTAVAAAKRPPPPPPPPRSKRCPPDPKDNPRDKKCDKGGDSRLP
jgi:hypothetical protein